ncbi:MAG TPA: amidohydrolase family protein [bacterium]|nr:amidohydrolase family protein [bacterium]
MAKYAWLKSLKKTAPEIPYESPLWLGNHSNGEYFHLQTPEEARMRAEILRRGEEIARKRGIDRREFLYSTGGMALALSVVNEFGCGKSSGNKPGQQAPFCVNDSGDDAANANLTGNEFIFDVQTHCFDNGEWRTRNIVYPTFLSLIANCTDEPSGSQLDCLNQQHYVELMYIDSDTTMSVITAWPAAQCYPDRDLLGNPAVACGLPLSNEAMRNLRDWINSKGMSQRCINQFQVMPNDQIERQIQGMYAAMQDPAWKCGSWKAYPAWTSDTYPAPDGSAQGYYMTDPIGIAFIEAGLKLGVPNFAIHKGLPIPGFDVKHNEPTDIGPIAKMFPNANFVIYHSGINARTGGTAVSAFVMTPTENVPYDPAAPEPMLTGVNVLIRSLITSGVIADPDKGEPFKPHNVYAEMGSAWSQVMTKTTDSQHYMGKLLKYLGPDNIVWGTDCILSGSPQRQIMAFRAFSITQQFQDMYGYPEITDEMKRKIFGLNAAKLYRIDPAAQRCKIDGTTFAMQKKELDDGLGPGRWAAKQPLGPRTLREFWDHARESLAKGIPG